MQIQKMSHITILSILTLVFVALWSMHPVNAGEHPGGTMKEHAGSTMQSTTGVLDGKTFAGEVGEKGKSASNKDELIFKDGKFRSTACDKYGFGDGAYTTSAKGANITFVANTESPTDGKNLWQGKVSGDNIEGSFLWAKPGQKPVEYWFKGSLKK